MNRDRRQTVGRIGEEAAARLLMKKGYRILDRNWRSKLGEIDIVASQGELLVIVEVRTTTGNHFGAGMESVDYRKQQKVRRLATQYAQMHHRLGCPQRIDVMSVLLSRDLTPVRIDHIEGAF
ncbi:YraN family protein [Laceyella sacchari]|jgi:putative endonuclease|uniref:UPF0102 protein SAMN06265361_102114 n=2 Tax=Laceyella TaxID=292635 RepID=A0AA45WKZ8_9BACL|nr:MULTISPECIES: YraN family protein [Laceyella]AUS09256.1 YraN family protein [Laceyella sacchari]MRG28899.1 YraN family protein [Laceyella tengchongensis]PRZ13634.1 putative endonuclease [Laceyella sediminis]SMP09675.1 putative endonuclease [Laceyella tengchongensis]